MGLTALATLAGLGLMYARNIALLLFSRGLVILQARYPLQVHLALAATNSKAFLFGEGTVWAEH